MSDKIATNLREGYLEVPEMADERNKSPRTLRAERQRGDGPPWVRDGRDVLYPIEGYRSWLKTNERHPVRDRRAVTNEKGPVAGNDRVSKAKYTDHGQNTASPFKPQTPKPSPASLIREDEQ